MSSLELLDAVFIDTSVLRGNHYNFASPQVSSFVAIAKAKGLKLLLPKPTSDEIERHISEGAKETVEQLRSVFRKSLFLKKWDCGPMLSYRNMLSQSFAG